VKGNGGEGKKATRELRNLINKYLKLRSNWPCDRGSRSIPSILFQFSIHAYLCLAWEIVYRDFKFYTCYTCYTLYKPVKLLM